MTFQDYFRWTSTLMVLTGFFSISITGNYLVSVYLGMIIALANALSKERLSDFLQIPRFAWNGLALIFLAYYIYDSFFGDLDLVGNGIKFVVYLQIVKILSPKTNRDQIQIYLLSFLHVLASTVLSSDVSFVIPFLLYVVLATWALSLFNLKLNNEFYTTEANRPFRLRALMNSRDVINGRFLGFTSMLAVGLISITLIIFFTFPRLSFRNFLTRKSKPQSISGFSESVELGTIGTIKTNNSIAIRVEIPPEQMERIDPDRLYWRATAADHFDGRTWSKSEKDLKPTRIDRDDWELETNAVPLNTMELLEYRVFLEALSTPVLVGADRLKLIRWDKTITEGFMRQTLTLGQDDYGGYRFYSANPFATDLTYHATSYVGSAQRIEVVDVFPNYDEWKEREKYLQVPELDPGVEALLKSIVPKKAHPYDQALELVSFIESNYGYTLDVDDYQTDNPLRFFFLEKKKGHCEYLSTALAIALRYHGIPARQVMGFRGGEYNLYGQYLAVRQKHAHTWVEVYMPPLGWLRLDPSPLDSTVSREDETFKAFYHLIDYFQLRWNKYILEYDLAFQASFVEKIGSSIRAWSTKRSTREFEADPNEQERLKTSTPSWKEEILLIFVLSVGVILGLWRWTKRTSKMGSFQRVIAFLAKRGYRRDPQETLGELIERIQMKEGKSIPSLSLLANWYYEERFGGIKKNENLWKSRLVDLKKEFRYRNQGNCSDHAHKKPLPTVSWEDPQENLK